MTVVVETVTAATDEVRNLISDLDRELAGPYAADQHHGLSLADLFQPSVRFLVARLGDAAVGCGGVALFDDYAELKRMYCRDHARGCGVAQAVLEDIESITRDAGRATLRLETGIHQHAAIKFYERNGFRVCEAFGAYTQLAPHTIELSAFYEKTL